MRATGQPNAASAVRQSDLSTSGRTQAPTRQCARTGLRDNLACKEQ